VFLKRYDMPFRLLPLSQRFNAAGWVWRDCKPANLIISKGRELKPVDFEGACPVECDDTVAWSTWEFAPPEWQHNQFANSKQPGTSLPLGRLCIFF